MKLISKNLAVKALEFSTLDADGHAVALSDFLHKSNVFLVFNRGFT